MYAGQTFSAKELNRLAIVTAINPFFVAELAMFVSADPPTFKSNKFCEDQTTFSSPEEQRVILETVSTGHGSG